MIINGDCLEELRKIPNNSIDAIVTDPPYELNFMGKGWDNAGISFNKETWQKCLRVLKPGGYLLAFGGTRTYHRIACAVEDAGFEIRDCIMWLYGSGFPKSMDIEKALNKRDGVEFKSNWKGWGTCLKPAYEPIIVARKPFKGSLVDNVMKYGVGGINIDECRVETKPRKTGTGNTLMGSSKNRQAEYDKLDLGRFPANTILTYDETDYEEVCGGFPQSKGGSGKGFKKDDYGFGETATSFGRGDFKPYNDNGSAARYFYCAKASKKDRDEGLDEFEKDTTDDGRNKPIDNPYLRGKTMRHNTHPTVKPTSLMQYLVRLVAPKGATILDPFMGSGSTGKAVMYENKERNANYKFMGIEKDAEYCKIAEARIKYIGGEE